MATALEGKGATTGNGPTDFSNPDAWHKDNRAEGTKGAPARELMALGTLGTLRVFANKTVPSCWLDEAGWQS